MNFRLLKYGSTSWIIDHRNNILAVKIYSVLLDQCWENQILYFLFCSTPRCIFQKCTVARCRLVWCGLHSCSGALSPRQLFLHSCSGALWPRQLFLFKTKLIIWGRVAVSKSLKILAMPRRGGGLTLPIFFVDFTVWKFVKILAFLGKCQEKDALKVCGGLTFRWLEVKFYIFWLSNNKFVYIFWLSNNKFV